MRRRIIGFLIFIVVAVGVAVGVYFAGEASDGTTAAEEGPEKPAATPGEVIEGIDAPSGTPTGPWEVPTCPPPTPTPTPPPPDESGPTTSDEAAARPWPCIPADQLPPVGTPAAPVATPLPDLSEAERHERHLQEREKPAGGVDLSSPVPYPIPINVAGRTIHLPIGSVYVEQFLDYPAGVDAWGPTHVHIIKRGQSKVTIDAQTGGIVTWDVAPEDESDFRRLILEPLQPLQ